MGKIKPLISSALVIAIVALFAATEVMAADQCGTPEFIIHFDGVTGNTYCFTIGPGDLPLYKISLLEFAVPVGISVSGEGATQHAPGEGGQGSFKFAENIPQISVVTVPPQAVVDGQICFSVLGAGGNVGVIGVHTQAGNKNGTCQVDGMIVGLPSYASVPSVKMVEIGGVDICVDVNPATGCPDQDAVPYDCLTKVPLTLDPSFRLSSGDVLHGLRGIYGAGTDPRCPFNTIAGASNGCFWCELFGNAYGPLPPGCQP